MFIENTSDQFQEGHIRAVRSGWIEVICGSMFSGKTEELIRRLKRANYARQKVMIFKPRVDNRYDQEKVVSHDANEIPSTPVPVSSDILQLAVNIDVVGIDEAQFFNDELVNVCNHLANKGIRVIVAGLDMDYLGKPFGPIPHLLTTAEYVTKVHAICVKCGNLANYSHRITTEETLVVLGESESYEPLCRDCFSGLYPSVMEGQKAKGI
ncbi:MAG: thymidine kinase [Bacteroidota bacterium]